MNLVARVHVEESRHNQQNQTFHEDEETQHESPIIQKRVGVSDKSSHQNPAYDPYQLAFLVPHTTSGFLITSASD